MWRRKETNKSCALNNVTGQVQLQNWYPMIALSDTCEEKERGHRHRKSTPSARSIHRGCGIETVCVPDGRQKYILIPVLNYRLTQELSFVFNIISNSWAKIISQRSVVILKGKLLRIFCTNNRKSWYLNLHFSVASTSPCFLPWSSLEISPKNIQIQHIQYFLINDQWFVIKCNLK